MDQNHQMIEQYNIVNKVSADERVAESIAAVVEVFRRLELDYAIFGSCGFQTYFDYFFRLPNDIDVIIRRDAISKLRAYCMESGYDFIEETGRSKIYVDGFPVHVIPELFSAVNKANNTIFAQIDLSRYISNAVIRPVHMLCTTKSPKINVISVEMCLFMDLIRTINTNSLMTAYFAFSYLDINSEDFAAIVQNNSYFAATILQRLNECQDRFNNISYFSKEDILFAQNKIADLRGLLKRLKRR